ncbi:hypothetical protein IPF37_06290 [bacterium]|nr:MAG: hypothetical protein IPF37_06290 [bacterium]
MKLKKYALLMLLMLSMQSSCANAMSKLFNRRTASEPSQPIDRASVARKAGGKGIGPEEPASTKRPSFFNTTKNKVITFINPRSMTISKPEFVEIKPTPAASYTAATHQSSEKATTPSYGQPSTSRGPARFRTSNTPRPGMPTPTPPLTQRPSEPPLPTSPSPQASIDQAAKFRATAEKPSKPIQPIPLSPERQAINTKFAEKRSGLDAIVEDNAKQRADLENAKDSRQKQKKLDKLNKNFDAALGEFVITHEAAKAIPEPAKTPDQPTTTHTKKTPEDLKQEFKHSEKEYLAKKAKFEQAMREIDSYEQSNQSTHNVKEYKKIILNEYMAGFKNYNEKKSAYEASKLSSPAQQPEKTPAQPTPKPVAPPALSTSVASAKSAQRAAKKAAQLDQDLQAALKDGAIGAEEHKAIQGDGASVTKQAKRLQLLKDIKQNNAEIEKFEKEYKANPDNILFVGLLNKRYDKRAEHEKQQAILFAPSKEAKKAAQETPAAEAKQASYPSLQQPAQPAAPPLHKKDQARITSAQAIVEQAQADHDAKQKALAAAQKKVEELDAQKRTKRDLSDSAGTKLLQKYIAAEKEAFKLQGPAKQAAAKLKHANTELDNTKKLPDLIDKAVKDGAITPEQAKAHRKSTAPADKIISRLEMAQAIKKTDAEIAGYKATISNKNNARPEAVARAERLLKVAQQKQISNKNTLKIRHELTPEEIAAQKPADKKLIQPTAPTARPSITTPEQQKDTTRIAAAEAKLKQAETDNANKQSQKANAQAMLASHKEGLNDPENPLYAIYRNPDKSLTPEGKRVENQIKPLEAKLAAIEKAQQQVVQSQREVESAKALPSLIDQAIKDGVITKKQSAAFRDNVAPADRIFDRLNIEIKIKETNQQIANLKKEAQSKDKDLAAQAKSELAPAQTQQAVNKAERKRLSALTPEEQAKYDQELKDQLGL